MKPFKNKLAVTIVVLSVAFLGIIIFSLKSNSNICACIRGIREHAGKDPITKEPLSWMKYDDYLKGTASTEVSA